MTRTALIAALLWLGLIFAAGAQTLTFPALTGRVVDDAGLLGAADRAALTEASAVLETKTNDQLVIVTLKSLQGTSIEDYGYQLGRRWQIGLKDKNTGVLLIVAPNERKVRIEVGYGLEGTLTDALTKVIIENAILPSFRAGDFPGGIKRGAADIIRVLSGDADELQREAAQRAARDTGPNADTSLWPLIVLAVAAAGLLIFCTATKGGRACQGIMQIIFLMMLSGGGRSSQREGGAPFSGRGGSFGGGGSSGSW